MIARDPAVVDEIARKGEFMDCEARGVPLQRLVRRQVEQRALCGASPCCGSVPRIVHHWRNVRLLCGHCGRNRDGLSVPLTRAVKLWNDSAEAWDGSANDLDQRTGRADLR